MTQQHVSSADGTAIAVETKGDGPSVVLVDGAFGSRFFGPNVPLALELASRFTVLHYDRRGRGESGDTPPYAVERELEDLAAVIDAAGGSALVFGTSSGGILALRAAAHGLPVAKVAAWEPTFLVSDARPPLPDDYVAHLDELVASGRRGDAVAYFMTAATGLPPELVAPMRDQPFWPALEGAAHTLAYDGAVVGDSMSGTRPSADEWSGVVMPALVLDGGTIPSLTEGADAIAEALPNARRRTIAGLQHDADAAALAPVLVEFFEEA